MPILRSSFLSLRLFKLMPKWSGLLQRNLLRCLLIKSPPPIEVAWDTPKKSSSSANVFKEMKFFKAKEPMVPTPLVENVKVEKKSNVIAQKVLTMPPNTFVAKPKEKGKSLSKSQRGHQTHHFCHHCGVRGHTRPNCHKLHALKNVGS